MVKTPRTRHSKTERDPMTIELGPDEVSRVATEGEASGTDSAEPAKEDIGASEATAASSDTPPSPDETADVAAAREAPSEDAPEPVSAFAREEEPAQTETPQGRAQEQPPVDEAWPQAVPPPPSSPSRGSALAAGLAGGLIALVCGGLLQFAGVLGTPGSSTAPASVGTEIAALRSEIEGLKAGTGNVGEVSGRVDGLSQALDQVKTDIGSLRQAVESGSAGAGLGALNTKIAEIETRMTEIGPGPDGATPEEIAALNEKIAGVEALAKAATEAGSTVTSRLGALEQSLSALSARVDSQAQQPKVALAIAASALKAAIERGSPFEPELETLAAVAPQAPGLAELRAYAEKGIAARADIIAGTDAAAEAMIAAANPPSENADFFERLLDSAESMVTVRPIGAVEGPGVPETVARMEVALQAGDLAKAIAEFDTLPEPAKAAGAAFADKIRARLAVEQLADQAIAAAMQEP
jgi:hypothetical protein